MGQKVNPHGLRVGVIKDKNPHPLCKAGYCNRPWRCRNRKAPHTVGKDDGQAGLCQHR